MNNKLFFVPYAGGSSVTFKHWIKYLKPDIDLKIFEMSGHGSRLFDECYISMNEACEDFYSYLKSQLAENENYFLVGHCLGAVIIYETCILISMRKEFILPKRIFISGHGAMDYIHNENHVKDMDNKSMIDFFVSEGGMSTEYLDEELLELITPAMRSDVTIYEEYVFDNKRNIPKLDMTIFYGVEDMKTPENELKAWKKYSDSIEYISFEGGHYFLNNQHEKYLDTMRKQIVEVMHD